MMMGAMMRAVGGGDGVMMRAVGGGDGVMMRAVGGCDSGYVQSSRSW